MAYEYDEKFIADALDRVRKGDRSIAAIDRDLGMDDWKLRQWCSDEGVAKRWKVIPKAPSKKQLKAFTRGQTKVARMRAIFGCFALMACHPTSTPRDLAPAAGSAQRSAAAPSLQSQPNAAPEEVLAEFPELGDWLTLMAWEIGEGDEREHAAWARSIEVRPPEAPDESDPDWKPTPIPRTCVQALRSFELGSKLRCLVAPSGAAWFIEKHVGPSAEPEIGWWRVVQITRKGPRFGSKEPFEDYGGAYSVNPAPVIFHFEDLTGDDVEEAALFGIDGPNAQGYTERTIAIYESLPSGLERVGPTRDHAAFALRDCDGDGHRELYFDPHRKPGSPDSLLFEGYNRRSSTAWSLIAEGTGKGFRVDGPLAIAYARALCADVGPGPLAARNPGTWPHMIHCKRLAGDSAADVTEDLRAACSAHLADGVRRFCDANLARLAAMASTKLPITTAGATVAPATQCLLLNQ